MNNATGVESVDLSSFRPDAPALADAASKWRSAYIHIPFCLRRCPYCDFAIVDESVKGREHVERYVDALVEEIAMQDSFGPLDAINFGGGTPTRLSVVHLARIVGAASDTLGLVRSPEVSLEANPEDWTHERAVGLVEAGFTRVSIGAQSFDSDVLRALGRVHDAADIVETVRIARESGFRSVSVDLIFGHPAETDRSWRTTVERALALGPDHVSTYSLTVEPGTVLAAEINAGAPAPDDDIQADRYGIFTDCADAAGIYRYEVSNHAATGHVCRYNLATWANAQYAGFGLGAHDHLNGVRSRNLRTIDRYLAAVESGVRPRAGSEILDPEASDRDRFLLGLRLASGVENVGLARRFIDSLSGTRMVDAGVVAVVGDRIRVAKPMLTDAVIREALSVSAGDC